MQSSVRYKVCSKKRGEGRPLLWVDINFGVWSYDLLFAQGWHCACLRKVIKSAFSDFLILSCASFLLGGKGDVLSSGNGVRGVEKH